MANPTILATSIKTVELNLTANELKALFTSPQRLLKVAGVGRVYQVLGAQAFFQAGDIAFDTSDAQLALYYGTPSEASQIAATAPLAETLVANVDTAFQFILAANDVVTFPATACDNASLYLGLAFGETLTGNDDNDATLRVLVTYRVVRPGW